MPPTDHDQAFRHWAALHAADDGIGALAAARSLISHTPRTRVELFRTASVLFSLDRFTETENHLVKLETANPKHVGFARKRLQCARRWQNSGLALELARSFVDRFPDAADGPFQLSVALETDGQLEEAAAMAVKAISAEPVPPHFIGHAGRLSMNLSGSSADFDGFADRLRHLADGGAEGAWQQLCALHMQRHGPDAALTLILEARKALPNSLTLLRFHANILSQAARFSEAGELHALAHARHPRNIGVLNSAGAFNTSSGEPELAVKLLRPVMAEHPLRQTTALFITALTVCSQHEEAGTWATRLVETYSDDAESLHYLCGLWLRHGVEGPAATARTALAKVEPRSARCLGLGLYQPTVPWSETDIEARLESSRTIIRDCVRRGAAKGDLLDVQPHLFYLDPLFSGRPNRDHNATMALGLLSAFPEIGNFRHDAPARPEPAQGTRPKRKRLKLGIMSPADMSLVDGVLAQLDRAMFEVVLFVHPTGTVRTDDSDRWRQCVDRICIVPASSTAGLLDAIAKEDLDLFSAMAFQMAEFTAAHARLAPVQFVWAEPAWAEGAPALDYVVSWQGAEPEPAAGFYNSEVVQLKHPPYWMEFASSDRDELDRSAFDLPVNTTWYCCAQSIHKLHPAFDEIIASILERDASGIFILLCGNSSVTWRLRHRLKLRLGQRFERVHILPRLPRPKAHRLLQLADALVDSYPIGGMSSTFAALGTGVPTVTLPANVPFGRWAKACFQYVDLEDLIADSPDALVEKALRLAHDETWRASLRGRIAERKGRLERCDAGVAEFSSFLVASWERSQRGLPPGAWANGAFRDVPDPPPDED